MGFVSAAVGGSLSPSASCGGGNCTSDTACLVRVPERLVISSLFLLPLVASTNEKQNIKYISCV